MVGTDSISANMIDKTDEDLVHCCLRILWNKVWLAGDFVHARKEENSRHSKAR